MLLLDSANQKPPGFISDTSGNLQQCGVRPKFLSFLKIDTVLSRRDLNSGTRLVLIRALRVQGFTADIVFSAADAASAKAKYSGQITSGLTGELGAGLTASWTDDTTLRITATDFYIAGELGRYTTSGFASGQVTASRLEEIPTNATVGRESSR